MVLKGKWKRNGLIVFLIMLTVSVGFSRYVSPVNMREVWIISGDQWVTINFNKCTAKIHEIGNGVESDEDIVLQLDRKKVEEYKYDFLTVWNEMKHRDYFKPTYNEGVTYSPSERKWHIYLWKYCFLRNDIYGCSYPEEFFDLMESTNELLGDEYLVEEK